jgi:predicted molibdopterin-dependent oxidoreductase YjgC
MVIVPARLTGIEPGVVFIPFHYGDDSDQGPPTAANRLTISGWDPVSKQPHFKYAAVAVRAVAKPVEPATDDEGRGRVAGSHAGRRGQSTRTPTATGRT